MNNNRKTICHRALPKLYSLWDGPSTEPFFKNTSFVFISNVLWTSRRGAASLTFTSLPMFLDKWTRTLGLGMEPGGLKSHSFNFFKTFFVTIGNSFFWNLIRNPILVIKTILQYRKKFGLS